MGLFIHLQTPLSKMHQSKFQSPAISFLLSTLKEMKSFNVKFFHIFWFINKFLDRRLVEKYTESIFEKFRFENSLSQQKSKVHSVDNLKPLRLQFTYVEYFDSIFPIQRFPRDETLWLRLEVIEAVKKICVLILILDSARNDPTRFRK